MPTGRKPEKVVESVKKKIESMPSGTPDAQVRQRDDLLQAQEYIQLLKTFQKPLKNSIMKRLSKWINKGMGHFLIT